MSSPERYPVRVMVTDVWDHVPLSVDDATTVSQLKRDALRTALRQAEVHEPDYVVKFRGARVFDESISLGTLGARSDSPFIVLPARRQPVR